jgi:hypothetical protein
VQRRRLREGGGESHQWQVLKRKGGGGSRTESVEWRKRELVCGGPPVGQFKARGGASRIERWAGGLSGVWRPMSASALHSPRCGWPAATGCPAGRCPRGTLAPRPAAPARGRRSLKAFENIWRMFSSTYERQQPACRACQHWSERGQPWERGSARRSGAAGREGASCSWGGHWHRHSLPLVTGQLSDPGARCSPAAPEC